MVVDRWVGQVLGGRYKIEELLGQGGMSSVYRAYDPNLQRTVAVKLIHPHLSNNDEFVRRFESEATAIARLRHPNIVQVFDFNHDDDLYFMVLEFVAGETLQNRIKRQNERNRHIPLRDVLRYTMDVCKAADYAHQRGLIHRDIKPANVMLDVNGDAILMDFGIARILGGQQHTATGAVLGTALYMSPEQIQGLHPDARSDIYSIGIMLFEALGGRPPFEADSVMTLMMMHLNDPVPDLSRLHPGIPESIKKVVNCALEKDRGQRYKSCQDMICALQGALDGLQSEIPAQVQEIPAAVIQPLKAAPIDTVVDKAPPVTPAVSKVDPESGIGPTIIEVPPQAAPMETIIEQALSGAVPDKLGSAGVEPAEHQTKTGPTTQEAESIPIESSTTQPNSTEGLISRVDHPFVKAQDFQTVQKPVSSQRGLKGGVLWGGIAFILMAAAGGGLFLLKGQAPVVDASPTPPAAIIDETLAPYSIAETATWTPTVQRSPTDKPVPSAIPTQEPSPTTTPAVVALPIIGGADKIAYIFEKDIWIVNVDGSNRQQVTSDGTSKKNLRWLPDGQGFSFISGKCIQTADLEGTVETITCFNYSDYLDSFEVSPDGKQAALSVDRQLYLIPFDREKLSQANSHSDLTAIASCDKLAPYERNSAVGARWSRDSKALAIISLGVLGDGRRGEIVQVVAVDRCIPNPVVQVQFPQPHFTFGDYSHTPVLSGLAWDGEILFALNGLTRNDGFGDMHIFNRETYKAMLSVNPIKGVCCYNGPQFSPDGQYLLFAFQDITLGKASVTQLYIIPFGTMGSGAEYQPLPLQNFTNPKEIPQAVFRTAVRK